MTSRRTNSIPRAAVLVVSKPVRVECVSANVSHKEDPGHVILNAGEDGVKDLT
jgi:hypothetical protein